MDHIDILIKGQRRSVIWHIFLFLLLLLSAMGALFFGQHFINNELIKIGSTVLPTLSSILPGKEIIAKNEKIDALKVIKSKWLSTLEKIKSDPSYSTEGQKILDELELMVKKVLEKALQL